MTVAMRTSTAPKMPMITPEQLRVRIAYDALSGHLTWLARDVPENSCARRNVRAWNTRYAGTPAFGYRDRLGYGHGQISGENYLAHRIAWAIHYGRWPDGLIDHIDGDPTNNRIDNLRVVDSTGNTRNQRRHSRNTTGVTGVSYHRAAGKYWAQIGVRGEVKYLGLFDDLEAAAAARRQAEITYGFHPNHGRVG
jgi:hypothetical protein